MKVKAVTLGCKVNAYESEYILSSFKDRGYEITNDIADIYIVNTCSVTNTSDAKSRKVINRLIRENPNSIIVVMGCMIEANKDMEIPGVSLIIGNKDKNKVVDLVENYLKDKQVRKILYDNFDDTFEDMFITNMTSHTRAFVKIQDGCENFCSYCIIPYTRGNVRSKSKEDVLREIKTLINNGHKEIVLTGIHTGHYGEDNENYKFPDLLKDILKIKGLERLRISSIEITELNDEFLEVLKNNPVLVDHMHIPLQSGSEEILKAMNRKYDMKYYKNKIEQIRQIRPNISITTDLIVGFPGETEDNFKETLINLKEIAFTKIHVFPYSRRKGTVADNLPNQIDENIKKERVKKVLELSKELEIKYMEKFINQEITFIPEVKKENYLIGHTGNYLLVKLASSEQLNHDEKYVKISKVEYPYVVGILTK